MITYNDAANYGAYVGNETIIIVGFWFWLLEPGRQSWFYNNSTIPQHCSWWVNFCTNKLNIYGKRSNWIYTKFCNFLPKICFNKCWNSQYVVHWKSGRECQWLGIKASVTDRIDCMFSISVCVFIYIYIYIYMYINRNETNFNNYTWLYIIIIVVISVFVLLKSCRPIDIYTQI